MIDSATKTALDRARASLALKMLNQVGVEWDEACDSVEALEGGWRSAGHQDAAVFALLQAEACRYEDM